jgi:hypothetical protein
MPDDIDSSRSEEAALSVIARSLAFLCLHIAELRGKEVVPQAALLESLGISRADAAKMLNTTAETIRVGFHNARKKKGGKGGAKKKRSAKDRNQ